MKRRPPVLIAIVGGSGAGKTWLARKLQTLLGLQTAHVSLDDFYRDRSGISPALRAKINFDHPRAIDWPALKKALRGLQAGRPVQLPCYDFKTHCRLSRTKILQPAPFVLVDGLWLLRRPALRRMFTVRVFIDCSTRMRRQRRLDRDLRSRGRTRASVQRQFRETVEPMHVRFVAPQRRYANMILPPDFGTREIQRLRDEITA